MTPDALPDRWMVVEVDRPAEEWQRDVVVDLLSEMTGRGAVEDGGVLRAYLPLADGDEDDLARAVSDALATLSLVSENAVRFRSQPHEDWVEIWRTGVSARRVTPRLVVSPTWDPHEPEGDEIVIHLDPGVAFGTAEHATTRGCLRLLEGLVRPGDRVGDFGSGSGILSIAAAKLGASHVLAVDSDPLAHGTAVENAERNGVADLVSVHEGLVDERFLSALERLDGIVANIEAGVLAPLVQGLRDALADGGWLILSGIQGHEAPDMVEIASRADLELKDSDDEPGWWSGAFRLR